MNWNEISEDYLHGILLGYHVNYSEISSNITQNVRTVNGSTTSIKLEELEKFTKYNISVSAFTSKGDGPLSDEVTVSTDEDGK